MPTDHIDKDSPAYMFGQIQTQYGFIVQQLVEIKNEQIEIKKQLGEGQLEFADIKRTLATHEQDISILKAAIADSKSYTPIETAMGAFILSLIKAHKGKLITGIASLAVLAWSYLRK